MWFDEIPWDVLASSRSSNSDDDSQVKQTFKCQNVKIHPILVLLSFTLLFPEKNNETSAKQSQLIVCDTHQRWIGRGLHYRFSWHWSHYRFIWRSMFFTHPIEQIFWRRQIKFCIVQIDLASGLWTVSQLHLFVVFLPSGIHILLEAPWSTSPWWTWPWLT